MTYRVILLAEAKRAIERNASWWAEHHSAEQAARWMDAVHDQLHSLEEFPESHSLSPENDDFDFEIRDKLVGLGSRKRYRAVFTIQDNEVFVLALRAAEQGPLVAGELDFELDSD